MKLDIGNSLKILTKDCVFAQSKKAKECNEMLETGGGKGRDFLGWLFPSSITKIDMNDIKATAYNFCINCEVVVVIGIGGSYLGSKAVISALSNSFGYTINKRPTIVYAGYNINEDYLYELLEYLKNKVFGIVSISKSGATIEPALSFRFLKKYLESIDGKENAKKRIVVITDKVDGPLRMLANQEGYKTYTIPNNIGGRFSVLTPAGLLPIAIAGIDIDQLINGAVDMEKETSSNIPFEKNLSELYAVVRNELYKIGKKIEILVNFHPKLYYVSEWWKQLYAESEGKEFKGIFTAAVNFTTDLHSMGQWIQESERTIFETVISIANSKHKLEVPLDEQNFDELNFLSGKRVDYINKMAELGTQLAHVDGGVPNIRIEISELNEYCLGQLLYFFERACGISGYLLGVNPFNQPGVEAYKKNMFNLLKKSGC
jgi:glucose-6-phosphate isomerase